MAKNERVSLESKTQKKLLEKLRGFSALEAHSKTLPEPALPVSGGNNENHIATLRLSLSNGYSTKQTTGPKSGENMKNSTAKKMQILAICLSVTALVISLSRTSRPTQFPQPCPPVTPLEKEWIQGLVDSEAEMQAGVRTVLTAMKAGESCVVPDSIFKVWPQDANGDPIVSENATLLVYKDTNDVTQRVYLPAETPVWCTKDVETSGKLYVHLVKGPGDKRPWFQIRGAETILAAYTMDCWDTLRPERQARMVEVDIRR